MGYGKKCTSYFLWWHRHISTNVQMQRELFCSRLYSIQNAWHKWHIFNMLQNVKRIGILLKRRLPQRSWDYVVENNPGVDLTLDILLSKWRILWSVTFKGSKVIICLCPTWKEWKVISHFLITLLSLVTSEWEYRVEGEEVTTSAVYGGCSGADRQQGRVTGQTEHQLGGAAGLALVLTYLEVLLLGKPCNKAKCLLVTANTACTCMQLPMRRLNFWWVCELLTQVKTRDATATKNIPWMKISIHYKKIRNDSFLCPEWFEMEISIYFIFVLLWWLPLTFWHYWARIYHGQISGSWDLM